MCVSRSRERLEFYIDNTGLFAHLHMGAVAALQHGDSSDADAGFSRRDWK